LTSLHPQNPCDELHHVRHRIVNGKFNNPFAGGRLFRQYEYG
jgi:hypothetical protein